MSQVIQSVLVLGYVWPEPNSSAAGGHMLSLLETLVAEGWDVTFASPAQRGEHKIDLTTLGITEREIALNCDSFDVFVSAMQPDLVLFDRFMLEEQYGWRVAKHCPEALRVLDTEDLHFLRQARHQAVKKHQDVTRTDLHTDMAKREVAAIFRSDLTLIISDAEQALLQTTFHVPDELLLHLPFMLAVDKLPTELSGFTQRQHFISIGNFRHAPNWDAVLQLKQHIWPRIRAQLPDAELHIYGAYPPPKATQLDNPEQGFLVKGWAADAQQVMKQSRVCLAPLRFGAGIKGKLAEAMWCGTPSITTNIGAEGMFDAQVWPGAVANNAEEFVDAAVALYQDELRWQQYQTRGHQLLKETFDRNTHAVRLVTRLKSLKQTLSQHRRENFIGAMLQHHQHKSTQYMAQWIQAKNRPPQD